MRDAQTAELAPRRPRYHVIVNPTRIAGVQGVEGPRSYETREAAEKECDRLNVAAGSHAYLVIITSE